jgi:hypothetical protein
MMHRHWVLKDDIALLLVLGSKPCKCLYPLEAGQVVSRIVRLRQKNTTSPGRLNESNRRYAQQLPSFVCKQRPVRLFLMHLHRPSVLSRTNTSFHSRFRKQNCPALCPKI